MTTNINIKNINPEGLTKEDKSELTSKLIKVAVSVGQDPGEHAEKWTKAAHLLVAYGDEENVIGFSSYKFLDKDFIHIPAVMIAKKHQGRGVAGIFMRTIIKRFIMFRLKRFWYAPWSVFRPIYIIFRTQNPKAYVGFYKRGEVFPGPQTGFVPNEQITSRVERFVKKLWGTGDFDKNSYILRGAYKNHPGLAIESQNIQWSNIKTVDDFFRERININNNSVDALVVLVRLRFGRLIKAM